MQELTKQKFVELKEYAKKEIKKAKCKCGTEFCSTAKRYRIEGLIVELKFINPESELNEHNRVINKSNKTIIEENKLLEEASEKAGFLLINFPELEEKGG